MRKLIVGLLLLSAVGAYADTRTKLGVFAEREEHGGTGLYTMTGFGEWKQPVNFMTQRVGLGVSTYVTDNFSLDSSLGLLKVSELRSETWDMSGYTLNSKGTFWRVGLWYHFN